MQQPEPKSDRRRFQRHRVSTEISVELRVEVSGTKPAMLLTRGMVSDISRCGLRCDINFDLPTGTSVDVCFANGTLAPESLRGRVVRTISVGGVPEQVAITFARPLEQLDTDLLWDVDPLPSLHGRTATRRRASWADEPHPSPNFATGSLF